jgi:SepF-like predicted cell division protein (DUF552 family)
MSPFRKGSELRSVADSKVFIDLGIANLPEEVSSSTIHLMRPCDEKDLRHIKRYVTSGASVILDLSVYKGDADLVKRVVLDAIASTGIVPMAIGSDAWLLASKSIVVESHGKV